MSFQTYEYVDGHYRSRTVGLHEVLQGQPSTARPAPPRPQLPAPPTCGVLTRTVVESPIFRWIFPVRLRSSRQTDVAFVGDHFVQISELQPDQRLREVIRKNDFGFRIRNACVVGLAPEYPPPKEDSMDDIKFEDSGDVTMHDGLGSASSTTARRLPPQMLVVILESGDCVFLFVRESHQGKWEFVSTRVESPRDLRLYPGQLVAVNPSSRYMTLACPNGLLIVYELESCASLNQQYARNEPLRPVRSFRIRGFQGIIHKMEFLFPRHQDEHHIILLLIVMKNGKARMVTYEWGLGDNLANVFKEEKVGYRLPQEHRLPLMIIPLTVRTSFFAVSQRCMGVCKDALQGPPRFDKVNNSAPGTTDLHHGSAEPLWTAWTRPIRRKDYHETKDNIYMAREDGAIVLLEIDSANILASSLPIGSFNCTISTAFTSADDRFSDILIMGSDSGPGAIWKLRARVDVEQVRAMVNWAPALDFTTTDENKTWNPENPVPRTSRTKTRRKFGPERSDRLFGTSGRGVRGMIVEYRYGIRAEIDPHPEPPHSETAGRAWVFPGHLCGTYAKLRTLLAVPGGSFATNMNPVPRKTEEPGKAYDPNQSPEPEIFPEPDEEVFDVSSRTLDALQINGHAIVQITEESTTILIEGQSTQHRHADILNQGAAVYAEQASIRGSLIALSTRSDSNVQLHLLRLENSDLSVENTWDLEDEISSLGLCQVRGEPCIIAGVWHEGRSCLAIYPASRPDAAPPALVELIEGGDKPSPSQPFLGWSAGGGSVEQVTSIAVVEETANSTVLLLGTRSGHLLTVAIPRTGSSQPTIYTEKLGEVPAEATSIRLPAGDSAALVTCDSALYLLTEYDANRCWFKSKSRVWLTAAGDESKPSPSVRSAALLPHQAFNIAGIKPPDRTDLLPLLVVTERQLLIVELHLQIGPVPRTMPVHGEPTKVLYSPSLECLIVGMKIGDKPTIKFLDPDTGEDLSVPSGKNGEDIEFITGLGVTGDKIFGLYEWLYPKDGKTWLFIIVTTREGRLLIVSTQKESVSTPDGMTTKIRYWTRYRKKNFTEPIYSIVGDGDNLVFATGKALHWERLDLTEKKLKPMKTFTLDSAATSLRVVNGMVYVLTLSHSLLVLDPLGSDEIKIRHCDQVTRMTAHMIDIGGSTKDGTAWPVTLLCDRNRGFAGVWVPSMHPGKEFEVVFEGQLRSSVRRLRRGHTRPFWVQAQRISQFGIIPSTVDEAEVLGLCLDGSILHFTLLSKEAWRLLALIQNLAEVNEKMYPMTYRPPDPDFDPEPALKPATMQIDGDMLQRCRDQKALEALIDSNSNGTDLLREYLDDLDGGRWTSEFQDDDENCMAKYFELAYDILDYYLQPVF